MRRRTMTTVYRWTAPAPLPLGRWRIHWIMMMWHLMVVLVLFKHLQAQKEEKDEPYRVSESQEEEANNQKGNQ